MRRAVISLAILAFGLLQGAAVADPQVGAPKEKRVALILSNEDYPDSVGRLSLTHNDGDTIQKALESAQFKVTRGRDLDADGMEDSIAAFEKAINAEAADGDNVVAFFYASMHGAAADVEGKPRNFLLPVKEEFDTTGQLIRKAVRLDQLVQSLGATKAKGVIIVSDACRNTLKLASETKSVGDKGFGVERAAPGVMIVYATEAGATTPDDGVFAGVMAQKIRASGLKAGHAMLDTVSAVGAKRGWDSQPFMAGGVPDWFCFNSCAPAPPPAAKAAASLPVRAWNSLLTEYTKPTGDIAIELVDRKTGQVLPVEGGAYIARHGQQLEYRIRTQTPGRLFILDWQNADGSATARDLTVLFPNGLLSANETGELSAAQKFTLGNGAGRIVAQIADPRGGKEQGDLLALLLPSGTEIFKEDAGIADSAFFSELCPNAKELKDYATCTAEPSFAERREKLRPAIEARVLQQKAEELEKLVNTLTGLDGKYASASLRYEIRR